MGIEIVTIVLAAAAMLLLAVVMGFILGWANKAFYVPVDPKQAAIDDALPGANCGGCGYVGCSEYAEALADGSEEDVTKCPVGGAGCVEAVANILGVSVGATWPVRPIVHCSAHYAERLGRSEYRGEASCHAANMVAGIQGCTYGCLAFGDCVVSCEYDAIHIVDGLATVDYEKCTGCSACAKACPRNIISMSPFKSDRVLAVTCCNQDFGKEVKEVCTVGCIGCSACARNSDLIVMDGKVPRIDYEAYEGDPDFTVALDKCPRESLVYVGKPKVEEFAAAAGMESDEVQRADFATTVDEAEWRG